MSVITPLSGTSIGCSTVPGSGIAVTTEVEYVVRVMGPATATLAVAALFVATGSVPALTARPVIDAVPGPIRTPSTVTVAVAPTARSFSTHAAGTGPAQSPWLVEAPAKVTPLAVVIFRVAMAAGSGPSLRTVNVVRTDWPGASGPGWVVAVTARSDWPSDAVSGMAAKRTSGWW